MPTIGEAYVQIVPKAQGITSELNSMFDAPSAAAGNFSGGLIGGNLVSTLKKVVIGAGIGKVIGDALNQGGALQQSLGGVETLFGDAADTVKANAKKAFETTGLSANAYMESVTSFSASLLQSVAGDTERAAKISDMAMIDMSDNANKMGTSMESIQNAYQGFAKQNYTINLMSAA